MLKPTEEEELAEIMRKRAEAVKKDQDMQAASELWSFDDPEMTVLKAGCSHGLHCGAGS